MWARRQCGGTTWRAWVGVLPSASNSNTCQTITHVPLEGRLDVGMKAGSAMMCLWRNDAHGPVGKSAGRIPQP